MLGIFKGKIKDGEEGNGGRDMIREIRNIILIARPQEKKPRERLKCGYEDNIKRNVRKTLCGFRDSV
jgi:hypothetical protein